jgi:hypothetical protein
MPPGRLRTEASTTTEITSPSYVAEASCPPSQAVR